MRQQRLQRQSSDLDPKLSKINYAWLLLSVSVFLLTSPSPKHVPMSRPAESQVPKSQIKSKSFVGGEVITHFTFLLLPIMQIG